MSGSCPHAWQRCVGFSIRVGGLLIPGPSLFCFGPDHAHEGALGAEESQPLPPDCRRRPLTVLGRFMGHVHTEGVVHGPRCRTTGKTGRIALWTMALLIAGRKASPPPEPLRAYRRALRDFLVGESRLKRQLSRRLAWGWCDCCARCDWTHPHRSGAASSRGPRAPRIHQRHR